VSESERNRSVLIANETLYQLSYTPRAADRKYYDMAICQQLKEYRTRKKPA
jgi:hypothetical protein